MKLSQIEFKNTFPSIKSFGPDCLLIYDRYFDSQQSALQPIQTWIKKFPHRLSLTSGESLKDLKFFPEKMEQILTAVDHMAVKNVKIISLGGGSLGDFVGFVASILKRGRPLIHIPTTWLSAMDSSHGGKTALNVAGFKNQVGTFYPAERIILIKPILFQQPDSRSQEAFGEALKMALLTGGSLWSQFSRIKQFNHQTAWKFLPALIAGKYRLVKKDPYETKGLRHLLNLGHTLGHVWESSSGLPHGTAVNYGLRAAIEFSKTKKILSSLAYQKLMLAPAMQFLPSLKELQQAAQQVKNVQDYLLKDKKISQKNSLRFICLRRPGQCPILEVKMTELAQFHTQLQNGNIT